MNKQSSFDSYGSYLFARFVAKTMLYITIFLCITLVLGSVNPLGTLASMVIIWSLGVFAYKKWFAGFLYYDGPDVPKFHGMRKLYLGGSVEPQEMRNGKSIPREPAYVDALDLPLSSHEEETWNKLISDIGEEPKA